jgi:hypothetical protein
MRPDHGGDAAVEMPAHGHFFASQLGVKVDEPDLDGRRQCLNKLIRLAEGAIRLGHVNAALQIHDGAIDAVAGLHDDDAAAGEFVDIVGGAEQAGLAGEIVVDFALVPDVVAASQDVDAVAEQLVRELRRDAETAG